MKIRRIRLTKQHLGQLPAAERDFLLLAGHMLNEINSLYKVFSWSMRGHRLESPASALSGTISGAQAMIYARLLAGKEWEAWEALGKGWFRTKIAQRIEPILHPDSQEALKALKKYFSGTNLINQVRNSFAFHYSASAIGSQWERASEEPFFELILGVNIGNNFFLGAETAANVAVFNAIEPTNLQEGMRRFLEDVGVVNTYFTTFLEGVNMAIVEDVTRSTLWAQSVEDEVFPDRHHSQVTVPHFSLPDREESAEGSIDPATSTA